MAKKSNKDKIKDRDLDILEELQNQEENDESAEVNDEQLDDEDDIEEEETDIEDETEEEVETNNSHVVKELKKFNMQDLVWTCIGLVVGILLSYCIFNLTLKSAIQRLETNDNDNSLIISNESSVNDDNITTYTNPSVIISDEDKINEVKTNINGYLSGIKNNNTYSQVMVGEEEYVYYMYNSNGETFSQDGNGNYTEIFLNDGTVLRFDTEEGVLSIGSDIDIATLLENAVSAIGNENVTLYEMELSEEESSNGHEYRIDFVGEDVVKLLYSSIGDEFADDMVESIKASIPDWEPHIIMIMFIGEDKTTSYCCCLYVIDGVEYTNWMFQGYDTIGEWALQEDWYNYDAEKDADGEVYAELVNSLLENIDNIMLEYANSKGWLESEESVENTESTESNSNSN